MIDRLSNHPARLLALLALAGSPLLAAGCGSSSTNGSSSSGAAPNSSTGAPATAASKGSTTPPPRLTALLSASGEVTVTNSTGQPVTQLPTGHYTLTINVDSPDGDFHLEGPLIGRRTRPHFTGVVLWGVHLVKGTYRYLNDHSSPHPKVHTISVS